MHGFLGSGKDWQSTINILKKEFYCVTIDLPGHGPSVTTPSSLKEGFEQCHNLIKKVIQRLNIQTYYLIGYSLGGRIAIDYARTQNDERLQGLLLESSHIGFDNEEEKQRRYIHDANWAKKFATQSIKETLSSWYQQDIFSDLSDAEKEQTIVQRSDNYGVPLANMLLATSLGKQQDALPFLQKTTLPIYYCYGEKDKKFKRLAQKIIPIKNMHVTPFIGVGHNIHRQQPLQYAQYLTQLFVK